MHKTVPPPRSAHYAPYSEWPIGTYKGFNLLTRIFKTAEQRTIIKKYGSWYTDRWWVDCFGTTRRGLHGLRPRPVPSLLYQIKTVRPSTDSAPTCGTNNYTLHSKASISYIFELCIMTCLFTRRRLWSCDDDPDRLSLRHCISRKNGQQIWISFCGCLRTRTLKIYVETLLEASQSQWRFL